MRRENDVKWKILSVSIKIAIWKTVTSTLCSHIKNQIFFGDLSSEEKKIRIYGEGG